MDLTGQWDGTIVYGKEYRDDKGKELSFQMNLIQYGSDIAGTAVDTDGVGVSPDLAIILGKFINNRVEFLKQYDSCHYLGKDGKLIIDKSRKGPKIKYIGILNEANQSFTGFWKIRVWFLLFWIIPVFWTCTGTWSMKKGKD